MNFRDILLKNPEMAKFLLENYAGKRVYIPLLTLKDLEIIENLERMKKAGYSVEQMITALISSYEIANKKTARRKIKRFFEVFYKKDGFCQKSAF